MTIVFLFGGQGSQKTGMLHHWSQVPEVADHIAAASETLDEDVLDFDTAEALQGTRAVQLSLLVLQSGISAALQSRGIQPDFGAGHSLGAWSAAVAAGCLPYRDAVRLVDIRSTTMAASAPSGHGMSAVIGLGLQALTRIVDQLRVAGHDAWLTNLNSSTQFTVSGTNAALDYLSPLAADAGAQRVVRLKVAVPAHCPLMTPARQALEGVVSEVATGRPRFPLLANTTGRLLRTAGPVLSDLVTSTDQPVRWGSGIAALSERGIGRWVQVSPGNTLIGLLRELDDGGRSWCVDNVGLDETAARCR